MLIDPQMLVVLLIVVLAALYILRVSWRYARGKSTGCCSKGCGSDQPARNGHVIPSEELLQALQRKQPPS